MTRMSYFLLIGFFLLSSMLAWPNVVLTADNAQGGVLGSAENETQAVSLPTGVSGKYTWACSPPLEPGGWEVTVEFGPSKTPTNARQLLSIGSSGHISVDLSTLDLSNKAESVHFWMHTAFPISIAEVNADGRPLPTRPIRQIRIERAAIPKDNNQTLVLDEPASEEGKITFPLGAPCGNWKITPWIRAYKGTLRIDGDGDHGMEAPLDGEAYVYSAIPPKTALLTPGTGSKGVTFTYFAADHLPPPLVQGREPMPPFDPAKEETMRLKLIGQRGNAQLPTLPLLPGGAKIAVITSWDDGPVTDSRCADLLQRYGFKGTFFVNERSSSRKVVREIEQKGMEIGSHTVNHLRGRLVSPQRWVWECLQMRLSLEETLGHPVLSFAYPYNYSPAYDETGDYVLRGVTQAGYWSGRTTQTGQEEITGYRSPLALVTNGYFKGRVPELQETWNKAMNKPGSIFYFWGHSWDNKNEQDWADFEALLQRFSHKPGAWYATQGQLFLWRWLKANTHIKQADGEPTEIVIAHPKLDPYWAAQCPLNLAMPEGITHVIWRGQTLPVIDGTVTLAEVQNETRQCDSLANSLPPKLSDRSLSK